MDPVSMLMYHPKISTGPICEKPVPNQNTGRCHSAQITLKITADMSLLYFCCNRGSANPRQPTSSPNP